MTPETFVLLSLFSLSSAQFCRYYGCSPGYQCDTNTGICRQFRVADPGNVGCGACPPGTACDRNTGRCTPFRDTPIGNGASPLCARVYCPTGYYCDPSTGICKRTSNSYNPYYDPYTTTSRPYDPYNTATQLYDPYSSSSSSTSRCFGVVCTGGQQCDENTGICRYFRGKRQVDLCAAVSCPTGTSCDSNTGKCQSFRSTASGVLIIHKDDKCATVGCPTGMSCQESTGNCLVDSPQRDDPCSRLTCPQGTSCDSNTGKCQQFRPAADFQATAPQYDSNICERVDCPSGYWCDPSTGICQPTGAREDPCERLTCPQGTSCDSNTGMCRQFRPAADIPAVNSPQYDSNLCDRIECPSGWSCEPATGICQISRPIGREDPCARLTCPQGTSCDSNTGMCRQFRPAANYPSSICAMMYCAPGTVCNPSTGSCEAVYRDPTIPDCPANSHWEPCSSPCPYSCTHKGERCQLPCISTCVCNQGYVEASRTDLTCIPQQQCEAYNADRCVSPQCGPNESCVDDLCNSSLCPDIHRPSLRPGCQYILTRNINNCLMFDQKCDNIL